MRKEGYSETTIERYARLLKELAKHGDLCDPELVKIGLTQTRWADGTKEMACGGYALYAKQHGFTSVQKHKWPVMDAEVYLGAAVMAFLVKPTVVVVVGHIALAIFVPAWYASLTQAEYMVFQDFINAVGNLWRDLIGHALGLW
jgi:hypothetical protein